MMKNIFQLFVFSFLLIGCEKRLSSPEEYLPEIQLNAFVVEGGVSVSLSIIKPGSKSINKVGYSFSTNPDFNILENQKLLFWDTEEISTHVFPYYLFEEGTTYYFKAFVTNDYGLVISNEIEISTIVFEAVEAPCNMGVNTLLVQPNPIVNLPTNTSVQAYTYYTEYSVNTTGNNSISVDMLIYKPEGSVPTTGVYQTSNGTSIGFGYVRLAYNNWVSQFGGLVYINKISASQFSVEACDVPVINYNTDEESTLDCHWVINI